MNGSVQYNYLLNEIEVMDLIILYKNVTKLSREQAKQANKG